MSGLESAYSEFLESFQPDPNEDPVLNWLSEQFINSQLPPYWSEHVDHEGRVYYFDFLTKTSQWQHPLEELFTRVIDFVKPIRMEIVATSISPSFDDLVSVVEAELLAAQDSSLAKLEGWSGPYSSVVEEPTINTEECTRWYFYNTTLGISCWESPLVQVEYELSLRHDLLVHALFSSSSDFTEVGTSVSLEEDLSPRLAFLSDKLKLPLHLLRRDDNNDDLPPSPSSSSYYSARSPHHSQRDHPPPPIT